MSNYFFSLNSVTQALIASLFTWSVTALGAAAVYIFNKSGKNFCNALLSISAGTMTAAGFWSLLSPAEGIAVNSGMNVPFVLCIGFLCGGGFLIISDKLIKIDDKQNFMLIFSVTLHNIPEGLAMGVAFASANNYGEVLSALALAFGIALQNFPEGAAVSLPLLSCGYSKNKSFFFGQLSAAVEPVSALLGAYAVTKMQLLLPYALSFASGAMMYVVISELIPQSMQSKNKPLISILFLLGFCLMMALDVGLG